MNNRNLWVGVFVTVATLLFGSGLFLIGNQHKAFRKHVDFYTEFANIDGIADGAKVRVDGMDAGQVQHVTIPSSPAQKFRLKMVLDERLHGLIRDDSIVSIETEGVVGDQFLLIENGSDRSAEAAAGATLRSKEPFDLSKMLDQANGLLAQVGGTIGDVQGKLNGALDSITTTVNAANGLVTDIRRGKGTVGVLLENRKTAADVQQIVLNARQATASIDTAAEKANGTLENVNGMLQDVQRRELIAKMDETITSAKGATQQLGQASQQVNATLKSAFAEDQYGQDAGMNLQQSLSNIDAATGNLADDSEALKHEFFFKGFFKKRGYDSLDNLPVEPYRDGKVLEKLSPTRQWIAASPLFEENADGAETLSSAGRAQIDEAVGRIPDLYSSPLIVEGYAPSGSAAGMLVRSRHRAVIVRNYIQIHFHLAPKDTGVIGLSDIPPLTAGRTNWDGVCLVHLASSTK